MERTFTVEYAFTPDEAAIVEQIRLRIGDPKVLSREYIPASESTTSPKIIGDGTSYWSKDTKFWPAAVNVNGVTYSGTVVGGVLSNPSVDNYRYLSFNASIRGSTCDFWLDTFSISDYEIWFVYSRATNRVLERLRVASCLTDNMVFLQACLDCIELLRSIRLTNVYTVLKLTDGDTDFTRQLASGADPLKDLRDSIASELQALIDKCNKTPYKGGYRIE